MNTFKQRITSGWSWIRFIYLAMGIFIIVQSILLRQWVGVLFGGWFATMGLLGLGCAAGACCSVNTNHHSNSKTNLTWMKMIR